METKTSKTTSSKGSEILQESQNPSLSTNSTINSIRPPKK